MGDYVSIEPRDDASAQQASDWLTDLRAELAKSGHCEVAKVDDATPASTQRITRALATPAHLILYFGHGDSTCWKTNSRATVDTGNASSLGRRAVVAVTCKSGTQLGPDAITAGVDAYLGFTTKVGVIPVYQNRDHLGKAIVNGLKVLAANQSMQAAKDELVQQFDALSRAFDTGRLRNHPHATFGYFVATAMRDHVVLHGQAGLKPFAGHPRTSAPASSGSSSGATLADLTRAIQLDPSNAWAALASRGNIYREMERYDDALADLNRAIQLNPEYAWAIGRRGQTYQAMEHYDDARADFSRAIELIPDYAWVFVSRGQTYSELGRYDDALADLNRAIEIVPEYAWAIGSRGETYRVMGRYDDALADFNRAIELAPDYAWAIAQRGETYRLMKYCVDALADLNRAIELDPDRAWIIGRRGQIYSELGRCDDALTDLNRAIELDPDQAWIIGRRGETYWALGRYDDALTDLNRAIELDPDQAWIIGRRGETYWALGRYDDALTDLNRAIELDPSDDDYAARRAQMQRLMGKGEDTVAEPSSRQPPSES